MSIANQVKSLTENIEASYGTRITAVSDIVKETHQTLGNFNRGHKKMADDLRDLLSASGKERSVSEKERIEEFTTLIGEIKGAVTAIEKDTAETLADFRSSHKEMSEAQGAELVKITKERVEEVSQKLSEFGREHQKMARQLRGELSSFQKKLEREVAEMRAPVIADLKEARRNWQNLAKVMAAKKVGKPIPGAKTEMGVSQAVKEEAEEAFGTRELKERVLKVIQAHPGGITLPEIGKVLRIAYIRISRPIKGLLEEMVVTKRDSEYFPA